MNEITRLPPQNIEAEMCVLACMMWDASKIDSVAELAKDDDFYADSNRIVFRAILSLHADGIDCDVVTVADKLEASGKLAEVGGVAGIYQILATVPEHAAHVAFHLDIVLEASRRRRAIAIGKRLMEGGYDKTEIIENVYALAEKTCEALTGELAVIQKNNVTLLSNEVQQVIDKIGQGIPTSANVTIPEIDAEIGGISLGELIVIAARPGHCKSLLAMQCVENAASLGVACLVCSEEMTKEQVAGRSLSFLSSIDPSERYQYIDQLRFEAKEHYTNKAPILIAEACGHISNLERQVAKAVKSHNVQIVAIDYAQMIDGDGERMHNQVADVSKRCKRLTKKYNIIVLLLAQLGREFDLRSDKPPTLRDLQHSSQLEQDADQVWALFWPAKMNPEYPNKEEYRVHFLKNRHRGIKDPGYVLMNVNGARMRLTSFVPRIEGEDTKW